MLEIKELSNIERLKLSLEYSKSDKHKKSLVQRIEKIEGKKDVVQKEGQISLFQ